MRWRAALALAIAVAAGSAGCSSQPRSRCHDLCRRETLCARELQQDHDLAECEFACKALDRDPVLQASVDRHLACVDRAAACADVLACE